MVWQQGEHEKECSFWTLIVLYLRCHIFVCAPNQSTLVKVLLGELQPVDGMVWLNSNVRIAYFTQHHIDQLNLGLTPVAWLRELFPGTSDADCRRHLARFGLMGELALLQIGHLSGG